MYNPRSSSELKTRSREWCVLAEWLHVKCTGDLWKSLNGFMQTVLAFEVLMITSQSAPGLLFPKGGWENDETVEEAALREALEEAGVRGEIKGRLGSWNFKSKSHRDEYSPEGLCKAEMFALFVTEELDSWPEQNARQRKWLTVAKAHDQCRYDWMRAALDECVARHGGSSLSSKSTDPASPDCSSPLSDQ